MSKLVKNSAIYAIGDIVPRLFSFICFPILTSYLSPSEYGIINYVNTLNLFLIVFSVLCLNTYYLVFYYRQPSVEEQKKLLGNLSIFIITITFVLSLIAYSIGFSLPNGGNDKITFYPYITIGIAINFFSVFSVLPLALFRLKERPLPLTIINVIKGGLILALTLVMVVFLGYKALGVLMATLVINIIFAPVFVYITAKNAIFKINWKQLKSALIFSLPLVPGALAYYLVSMSDRILIEKYVDLNSLGIYSTASTLALLLNIVSNGAYKAFEPYFFKIYKTPLFAKQFQKIHDAFLLILIISAGGLALFSREFFVLFSSEKFHTAYIYVPVILIGVLACSMSSLYGTIITAKEKTKLNSIISICGGIFSVFMNILLLPRLGIIVACITSALSFVGMMLVSLYFSKVAISLKRCLLSFLLMSSCCFLLIYVWDEKSIVLSIIIKAGAYLIVIYGCMLIMNLNLKRLYGTIFN